MSVPKLLLRVRSKVMPEVFNHPLWIDFLNSDQKPSPELIQHLRNLARQYETQGDMHSSSEILFLCAALQKQLKNFEEALKSLQHVGYMAENHDLPRFAIFAAWGTAALYYSQEDLPSAIQTLTRLQKMIDSENDWILLDLLELIKQTLRSPEQDAGPLSLALDWLKNWEEQTTIDPIASQPSQRRPLEWKSKVLGWFTYFLNVITSFGQRGLTNRPLQQTDHRNESVLQQNDWRPQEKRSAPAEDHPGLQIREAENISSGARHQDKPALTAGAPTLMVYCFGQFRVYQDEEFISEWPSGIGKSIFKYLITHRDGPVSKDRLMDLFWKDANPESARNNLNVAIYGLRQALRDERPDFSHLIYQDDHYFLNPEMKLWVDFEEFIQYYESGQRYLRSDRRDLAFRKYEIAENIYQGDFIAEDPYEDWILLARKRLKNIYLMILDQLSRFHLQEERVSTCIHYCQKILAEDNCREDAHRRLMICYHRRDQRYLALRQYQFCVEALRDELDVSPMSKTTDLYHMIREG